MFFSYRFLEGGKWALVPSKEEEGGGGGGGVEVFSNSSRPSLPAALGQLRKSRDSHGKAMSRFFVSWAVEQKNNNENIDLLKSDRA